MLRPRSYRYAYLVRAREIVTLSLLTSLTHSYALSPSQLVLHKQPKMLYDGLIRLINEHLDDQAKNRIEPAFPTSSLLATASTSSSTSSNTLKPRHHRKSSGNAVLAATDATPDIDAQAIAGPSSSQPLGENRLAQAMEGETFFNAIKGTWEDHKHCMGKLRDVLKYMVGLPCVKIRI